MRWAKNAKDASQRDILVGISRSWTQAALRLEWHVFMAVDQTALLKELRAKLD
jgi:hypothetical protein